MAVNQAMIGDFVEDILDTIREPLIVLNLEHKVVYADNSLYHIFKVN